MGRIECFVFSVRTDPRAGLIENLDEKMEDSWLLDDGVRLTEEQFPRNVELDLAKDGGNMLTDFVANIDSVVMVSTKAKAALESEGVGEEVVQFLPFTLRDKKRKKVPESYFIANVLQSVDCFDWERSEYETFPGTKKIIYASLGKLHVLEDKIPADAKLFRLGELKKKILIRSDLLKQLKAAGCTGINVLPMGADIP